MVKVFWGSPILQEELTRKKRMHYYGVLVGSVFIGIGSIVEVIPIVQTRPLYKDETMEFHHAA